MHSPGSRRLWLSAGALVLGSLLLVTIVALAARQAGTDRIRELLNRAPLVSLPTPTQPPSEPLADLLPVGKRATTATFLEVTPSSAPIRAGDVVDVVTVFRKGHADQLSDLKLEEDAVALVRDVTVLAVAEADAFSTPTDGTGGTYRFRTFTVAASPEETQLIALARQAGELRIGRCSTDECADRDLTAP